MPRASSTKDFSSIEIPSPDGMKEVVLHLTSRQKRFCEEYIIDFNGAAAVVRAGYSRTYANKYAYQLLKDQDVLTYIAYLKKNKISEIKSVDPEYIVQRVMRIIEGPGAKDSDRLRGLELLARHLGMFIERRELTGKDGGPLEINQNNIEEDAQTFTSLLKQLEERSRRGLNKDGKVSEIQDTEGKEPVEDDTPKQEDFIGGLHREGDQEAGPAA